MKNLKKIILILCLVLGWLSSAWGQLVSQQTWNNYYLYNAYQTSQWTITAPVGQKAIFHLTSANMGYGSYIRIYDGSSTSSPQLGYINSISQATVFISTGNQLYIQYYSGSSNNSISTKGSFTGEAFITPLPTSLYTDSNTITVGNYADLSYQTWLIAPNGGGPVTLDFSEFDTESGADFLKVYNGNSFNAPLIGSFSGNDLPPNLASSGDELFIEFLTDGDSNVGQGFSFSYGQGGSAGGTGGTWQAAGSSGIFYNTGSVGINTDKIGEGYSLSVDGKIRATEVNIYESTNWADFVFEEGYDLKPLEEVEAFIQEKGHLPEIPSAKTVEEKGFSLGDMDAKLLQKVEELTLYLIEQNKLLKTQTKQLELLKQQNKQLETKIQQLTKPTKE